MSILIYLLKVNLAIVLCWILYRAALRKLTFFQWNRIYLLGSVVLSFLLPLSKLQFNSRLVEVAVISGIDWTYMDHLASAGAAQPAKALARTPASLLLMIYVIVTLGLLFRSALRYRQLAFSTRGAVRIRKGRVSVYLQDHVPGSFTLFRRVYLDRFAYENSLRPVLRHEMVHAIQLHSIDLLLMEFVVAMLWFNPLVFVLSRAVRDNHEYLADHLAMEEQGSLKEYLECLKAETVRYFSPVPASNFKSSTIKKRIIMLTNHKSNRSNKWRYLGTLPLMALIILLLHTPSKKGMAESIPVPAVSQFIGKPLYIVDGIPSQFPLPEKYLERVTWGYNQEALHPISHKPTTHLGIDVAAPRGTRVFATADGQVKKAAEEEGWGKLVMIEHAEGFASVYAHLDEIEVEEGAQVQKGAVIGRVGSTGQSTGPHLHYEVRKNGEHRNPADFY